MTTSLSASLTSFLQGIGPSTTYSITTSTSSLHGISPSTTFPDQSSTLSTALSTNNLPILASQPLSPSSNNNDSKIVTTPSLTNGAKAGIGAGIAVGAIVIAVLLVLLIRSYKQRPEVQLPSSHPMLAEPAKRYEKPEMSGVPAPTEMEANTTQGRHVHELYTET